MRNSRNAFAFGSFRSAAASAAVNGGFMARERKSRRLRLDIGTEAKRRLLYPQRAREIATFGGGGIYEPAFDPHVSISTHADFERELHLG
jgi:hypothetical protein